MASRTVNSPRGEAARLEKNETKMENQERRAMTKHGGHLTKAEQNKINHEMNHTSKQIYKDRHN